jgi:hypothetical protein
LYYYLIFFYLSFALRPPDKPGQVVPSRFPPPNPPRGALKSSPLYAFWPITPLRPQPFALSPSPSALRPQPFALSLLPTLPPTPRGATPRSLDNSGQVVPIAPGFHPQTPQGGPSSPPRYMPLSPLHPFALSPSPSAFRPQPSALPASRDKLCHPVFHPQTPQGGPSSPPRYMPPGPLRPFALSPSPSALRPQPFALPASRDKLRSELSYS